MQDRDEVIEAQGGVLLAHTALITSVLAVFRAKGLLTQDDIRATFDGAMIGAEVSPVISPETTKEALVILEGMAQQMAGPRDKPGT